MLVEKATLIVSRFGEWVWLEEGGDLHHVEAQLGRAPRAPIGDAHIKAGFGSSFEGLFLESDSWDGATVEFPFELVEAGRFVSEDAKRVFAADSMLKASELGT